MEITYPYSHQDTMIRIRRQINTKAQAFQTSVVFFSELCSVYSQYDWLKF